jgi:hypothetical protein
VSKKVSKRLKKLFGAVRIQGFLGLLQRLLGADPGDQQTWREKLQAFQARWEQLFTEVDKREMVNLRVNHRNVHALMVPSPNHLSRLTWTPIVVLVDKPSQGRTMSSCPTNVRQPVTLSAFARLCESLLK